MQYDVTRFETYIPISELLAQYYDFSVTHEKCSQCSGYRKTWSCPEFDFDPLEFWKGFSTFRFIVDRVSNAGAADVEEAQNRLFAEKDRYDAEMRALEKETPGSYGLAAQECVACKKCARLSGHPCVHPDIMRYGLESIGILAIRLVQDKFGITAQWSDGVSIPDFYLLVGGVICR